MRGRWIFLLIAVLPLAGLVGLGVRATRGEQEVVALRLRELYVANLREIDRRVVARLGRIERELHAATTLALYDAEALRALTRSHPGIAQVVVVDGDGRLLHPPQGGSTSAAERALLVRIRRLLEDRVLVRPEGGEEGGGARRSGFLPRFWDNGLQLLFRRSLGDGRVLAVEVERGRLLAEVIDELPATAAQAVAGREQAASSPASPEGFWVLADSSGGVLYQWGRGEPAAGTAASAELPLSPPLAAWGLRYYAPPTAVDTLLGRRVGFGPLAGMVAIALTLAGLAAYAYREYARDMREAQRRLSFVDQVSHELKTPLTNVRMYAELLAPRLDDGDPEATRYAGIIVAESQRLSRLIGNVLTMSRSRRGRLELRPQAGSIDDTIDGVIEQFRPSLDAKGIAVRRTAGAAGRVRFDADALGQIVGNLIGNVEKYGAAGGALEIESSQTGAATRVVVRDRGPGVPAYAREEVFRPFHRLGGALTDGVAGTGIGLSIARELAEMHGGGLELMDSAVGACFELTLAAPPAADEERGR